MITQLAILASHIGSAILLANVLLFVIRRRKMPLAVQRLGWFLLLSLATEIAAQALFSLKINNLFLLHLYTLLEWLAWSYFYYYLFRHHVRFRKLIPYVSLTWAVLILLNSLFLEPLSGFNANAKTLVQLSLIAFAIYYFFTAFGKIDLDKAVPRSLTFINFATILYYSGSLFIFMVPKFLQSLGIASAQINGLWAVNALLLVVFHSLIFTSLWIVAFQKTKS
jgi:hypothetical protein